MSEYNQPASNDHMWSMTSARTNRCGVPEAKQWQFCSTMTNVPGFPQHFQDIKHLSAQMLLADLDLAMTFMDVAQTSDNEDGPTVVES